MLPLWAIKTIGVLAIGMLLGSKCSSDNNVPAAADDPLKRVKVISEDQRGQIVKGSLGNDTFWAIVNKEGDVIDVELHNEWGQVVTNQEEAEFIKGHLERRF